MIGVSHSAIPVDGGFKGYYVLNDEEHIIPIVRKTEYDAEMDVMRVLKEWSIKNNTPIIFDYHIL